MFNVVVRIQSCSIYTFYKIPNDYAISYNSIDNIGQFDPAILVLERNNIQYGGMVQCKV